MLRSSYLLKYLIEEHNKINSGVSEYSNFNEVLDYLDIPDYFHDMIFKVLDTGVKLDYSLSVLDIIELYKLGFNYIEIGFLKGIRKESVRLSISRNILDDNLKNSYKESNKENRYKLKYKIYYKKIVKRVEQVGKEQALIESGYTKEFFNRTYNETKRKFE